MVWEKTLYNFYYFTFVKGGGRLWSSMWFILVNTPYEPKKMVYSAFVGESSLQVSIISRWLVVCWVQLFPYWFSPCWICRFLIERCWSLQLFLLAALSGFVSCSLMLLLDAYLLKDYHVFWGIDAFTVFMLFFIPDNYCCFEISFVWKYLATFAFFRIVWAQYIFCHRFVFNLFASFYLKCVCCRQHIVGSCFWSILTTSVL